MVSTPSAIVVSRIERASSMTEAVIASESASSVMLRMKLRSIFNVLTGSR
jgi:hypothetical protein